MVYQLIEIFSFFRIVFLKKYFYFIYWFVSFVVLFFIIYNYSVILDLKKYIFWLYWTLKTYCWRYALFLTFTSKSDGLNGLFGLAARLANACELGLDALRLSHFSNSSLTIFCNSILWAEFSAVLHFLIKWQKNWKI